MNFIPSNPDRVTAIAEDLLAVNPPIAQSMPYTMMSLGELAFQIVDGADPDALAEFHERTAFSFEGARPMRLVEFVDRLRTQLLEQGNPHADRAYDLTIDRFSQLGVITAPGCHCACHAIPKGRADCRVYFTAFCKQLERMAQSLQRQSALEREMSEAKLFQGLVYRHFRLSLREAHRTALKTRYEWRLPGGKLTLLIPRQLAGQERRRWLEANVEDADPRRPGERARVQALIDERIGPVTPVSMHEEWFPGWTQDFASSCPVPGGDFTPVSIDGLAATVAQEKAANIHQQRAAIQKLGPERLSQLILRIFSQLADADYSLAAIAGEFGLSKPTLSRFAGIRWGNKKEADVPDLWRNTAQVLANDPDFIEGAKRAGVWPRVEELADLASDRKTKPAP